jgi:peptide/nickel transport system ATP-binding protein
MAVTSIHDVGVAAPATAPTRLEVAGLDVWFQSASGQVQAISDVGFRIDAGETVGLVGESGSGKSVTALALMGLLPRENARVSGSVQLGGRDLLRLDERQLRRVRGSEISMIFQDPMTALNPVFTIGQQLVATIRAHRKVTRKAARLRAIELLGETGIPAPDRRVDDYPHQLSGGIRQRAMIAMAISSEPQLLIADEPTTALDVTIQAQILDLLGRLTREHGTSVLLITHDLGVVAETCDRVVTMYAGQVVEEGRTTTVLGAPLHPYTSGLVRSIPRLRSGKADLYAIPGRVPALTAMPSGCRFRDRCEHAIEACAAPQSLTVMDDAAIDPRRARCCRVAELDLPGVTGR